MWLARDEDGYLNLYQNEPELVQLSNCTYWKYKGWAASFNDKYFGYDPAFPEVTFVNSPVEIEFKLKNPYND